MPCLESFECQQCPKRKWARQPWHFKTSQHLQGQGQFIAWSISLGNGCLGSLHGSTCICFEKGSNMIQWHPKINETKKQTSQMKQLKQIKPFWTMRTMRPMQPWPSHFLDDLSRGWRGSSQVLHRPEWWLSLALGAVRCCEELGFKIYQMSNEAKRIVKRFFWSACCLILHDTSWCPMSKMSLSKSQFFRIDVKCSCFHHQLAWSAFFAPDNDVYRSWVGRVRKRHESNSLKRSHGC